MQIFNMVDHRLVFCIDRLVDHIGLVLTDHLTVGRDNYDAKVVDFFEFFLFRFGGSGHPGKFTVEPEVVLEGDRCQGLVFPFDGYIFFSFQSLVQTVAEAPSRHQPSGEFVDDHHLVVLDHIIHVTTE